MQLVGNCILTWERLLSLEEHVRDVLDQLDGNRAAFEQVGESFEDARSGAFVHSS